MFVKLNISPFYLRLEMEKDGENAFQITIR